MRSPIRTLAVLALIVLSATSAALAWTARTRVQMTLRATELMPRTLRTALQGHEDALLRGLLAPMRSEDDAPHRPGALGGSLEEEIRKAAHALRATLDRPARFDEVAEAFGRLAHFTLDAGFPPATAARGPEADRRYRHFGDLCESRLAKFPLVYYDDQDLEGGLAAIPPYVDGVLRRAADNDAVLAAAYERAGDPPHPSAFDDRSVPFAVASISYSRSVNDVARVWLAVWHEARGDMTHLPYRK